MEQDVDKSKGLMPLIDKLINTTNIDVLTLPSEHKIWDDSTNKPRPHNYTHNELIWLINNQANLNDLGEHIVDVLDYIEVKGIPDHKVGFKKVIDLSKKWHRENITIKSNDLETQIDQDVPFRKPETFEKNGFEYDCLNTPRKVIEEAESQKHCIRTHMQYLVDGTTRAYSIKSKSSEDRYTIELKGNTLIDFKGYNNSEVPEHVKEIVLKDLQIQERNHFQKKDITFSKEKNSENQIEWIKGNKTIGYSELPLNLTGYYEDDIQNLKEFPKTFMHASVSDEKYIVYDRGALFYSNVDPKLWYQENSRDIDI